MSGSLSVSSLLFPIDIDFAKLDESDGDDDVNTVTDTTGPLSTVGHYQLQEPPLGSGAYATVYRATSQRQSADAAAVVAVKLFRHASAGDCNCETRLFRYCDELARTEVNVLRAVAHAQCASLPTLLGVVRRTSSPYILALVMPMYECGDLASLIDHIDRCLSERVASRMINALARALATIHACGYIHHDVKADNVLVRSIADDGTLDVVLGDFGLARRIGTWCSAAVGTDGYIPPEAQQRLPYIALPSFDVWSLGVLLHAVLTRCLPMPIDSCLFDCGKFSFGLVDVLCDMLHANATCRISLARVQKHPWVTHQMDVQ
jgi:serine/threonine protein kinase